VTIEEFQEKFYDTISIIQNAAERARRQGLLSLEEDIITEKILERDLYIVGIQFIVDGTDSTIVRKWFDLIIESSYSKTDNYYEWIIANTIADGVLMIQSGDNPRIISLMLEARCPQNLRTVKIKNLIDNIHAMPGIDTDDYDLETK
jgi:flagellar motor component MotA